MITVGMNEKAGGATNRNDPAGRLKLLESNVGIYKQILPEIFRTVPEAVILVVTDPPDPLADFVRTFGFTRVLSTGTFLDSLRFRFHVARRLNVNPARDPIPGATSVQASANWILQKRVPASGTRTRIGSAEGSI